MNEEIREDDPAIINLVIDQILSELLPDSVLSSKAYCLGRVVKHFKGLVDIPLAQALVDLRFSNA